MILVDANVLLYAYHPRAAQHQRCRGWVEEYFSGPVPVRLPWATITAFLRISTHPRVFELPLSMAEAAATVAAWLTAPAVEAIAPGERYWEILRGLLESAQVSGPLVTDAALAALALEHGATLCTTDRDFTRFPQLRTVNPLDG
ncbi:MAG: PIN domain-containing protein [Gemmatimonadetes bacterium]|nr:PIN domain-containing protein [Gemmatimonadota bacterium]